MDHLTRKINTILTCVLEFEEDEWSEIDFTLTPVTAKIKQWGLEKNGIITENTESKSVTIQFDLSGFNPGFAIFDVWIGVTAVPSAYNVRVNLIRGVADQ